MISAFHRIFAARGFLISNRNPESGGSYWACDAEDRAKESGQLRSQLRSQLYRRQHRKVRGQYSVSTQARKRHRCCTFTLRGTLLLGNNGQVIWLKMKALAGGHLYHKNWQSDSLIFLHSHQWIEATDPKHR